MQHIFEAGGLLLLLLLLYTHYRIAYAYRKYKNDDWFKVTGGPLMEKEKKEKKYQSISQELRDNLVYLPGC